MRISRSTRRAMLVVGIAAGLFAAAAAGLGLWQRHQRQRLAAVVARLETGLEALERRRRPATPIRDGANAGPGLLAAARDIPNACRRAFSEAYPMLARPAASWSRDEARRVTAMSAACAPSLEALRAAAVPPQVGFPSRIATEAIDIQGRRSGLLALLRAARLLALDARAAAEAGESRRLAANWSALVQIGTGLAREDSLLVAITATAVQTLELRLVEELLESGELPAGVAAELRRHFTSRARLGDFVSRSLPSTVRPFYAAGAPRPQAPWEIAELATGLECSYERLLAHVEAPWVQLEPIFDTVRAECACNLYATILLPNLRDGYERARAADAARQLAIVALTLAERASAAAGEDVLGGVPLAKTPNRYTGERVEITTTGEGVPVLRYPEAEERARADDLYGRLPFEYRLPRFAT